MMIISDTYTLNLLMISNAILLGAAGIAIARFQSLYRCPERFWNSPTGAAVADKKAEQTRQQLLTNIRLEKRMSDLQEKMSTLANKAGAPAERQLPIDNAVRMAKTGASVEELTRCCGLNIGEARLMQKLHGQPDVTTPR